MKQLPPFGRNFNPVPDSGVCVAMGYGAWDFASKHNSAVMVLPDDNEPSDFRWPTDGKIALIRELGACDTERLTAMAAELLLAGAVSVVAFRDELEDYPVQVFNPKVVS